MVSHGARRRRILRPALSRRGSYIAEAAVVLPFVILSVITVVLIVMYFYESSVSESRMHMALRCEAGLATGKLTYYADAASPGGGTDLAPEDLWDGRISSTGAGSAQRIRASRDVSMVSRGLLSRLGRRQLSGEMLTADPVTALRLRQIAHPQEADDAPAGANRAPAGGNP